LKTELVIDKASNLLKLIMVMPSLSGKRQTEKWSLITGKWLQNVGMHMMLIGPRGRNISTELKCKGRRYTKFICSLNS
jgi:hypothetical protein